MHNFHQGNQLPVSSTQVDQSMMIGGLPNNIPPNLPIQPQNQQQQQLAMPAAGYFLSELQNNAGKNNIRTFLFNFMSQGGYQNQPFAEALQGVMEYAEMLVATGQFNEQQACAKAAAEIAKIMSAVYAKQYPMLIQTGPQGIADEVERQLMNYNQIRQEIDRYHQYRGSQNHMAQYGPQQPWQNQGYGGGYPQQPNGGYGQQRFGPQGYGGPQDYNGGYPQQPNMGYNGGYPQQPNMGGPPMYNNGMMGHGTMQGGFGGPQQNPGAMGTGGNQGGGMWQMPDNNGPAAAPMDNRFNDGGGLVAGRRAPKGNVTYGDPISDREKGVSHKPKYDTLSGRVGEISPANKPMPTPQTQPPGQAARIFDRHNFDASQNVEVVSMEEAFDDTPFADLDRHETDQELALVPAGPDHLTDDDILYADDGSIAIPAKFSDLKLTQGLGKIGPMVYDPDYMVKYHVKDPEGNVSEILEPKDEVSDYERLKMTPNLKHTLPGHDKGPRVEPNHAALADAKVIPTKFDTKEEEETFFQDIKANRQALHLKDNIVACSDDEARLAAELILDNKLGGDPIDRPVTYEYQKLHLAHNPKVEGDKRASDLLAEAFECKRTDEFIIVMDRLNADPEFPDSLVAMINDRATAVINEGLKTGLGLRSWSIDSVMEDWHDLVNELYKEYGYEQGDGLVRILDQKAGPRAIAGDFRVADQEARDELFGTDGRLHYLAKSRDSVLVFIEDVAETLVPWRAEDVSLVLEEGLGVVVESKVPKLYQALSDMLKRADKGAHKRHHHYITTADNRRLEIKRGLMSKQHLVIHEIE